MSSKVMIKSIPNGLKIFLDKDEKIDALVEELAAKIRDSKGFFKGARIAISFEDRVLSSEEEKELITAMEDAGEMTVLYSIGKSEELDMNVARVVNRSMNEDTSGHCFGKLYTGSLKKGERLETETGIIVAGDIEPGATLVSKGNVIVLGGIYGTCLIETEEDEEYGMFIAAGNISAERLKIGRFFMASKDKPHWVIKPKMQAKLCFCENEQLLSLPVSSDSLSRLCGLISGQ